MNTISVTKNKMEKVLSALPRYGFPQGCIELGVALQLGMGRRRTKKSHTGAGKLGHCRISIHGHMLRLVLAVSASDHFRPGLSKC